MRRCQVCGLNLSESPDCPYAATDDAQAPWLEDFALMAEQKMRHREHKERVARWILHHSERYAETVQDFAKYVLNIPPIERNR